MFRRDCGARCAAPRPRPIRCARRSRARHGRSSTSIPRSSAARSKATPGSAARSTSSEPQAAVAVHRRARSRGQADRVPYNEAYADKMSAVATSSTRPRRGQRRRRGALKAYLEAAAPSFRTNDWDPADEAWANMTGRTASGTCASRPTRSTGTRATTRRGGTSPSRASTRTRSVAGQAHAHRAARWRRRSPRMIGAPYAARKVTFHLPDFIDIVFNAGDDRNALGATIGESLPNWGKVVARGRGRTIAMGNLYTDPDSLAIRASRPSRSSTRRPRSPTGLSRAGPALDHPARGDAQPRAAHEYTLQGEDRRPGVRRPARVHARGAQGADAARSTTSSFCARKASSTTSSRCRRTPTRSSGRFGHVSEGCTRRAQSQPYS